MTSVLVAKAIKIRFPNDTPPNGATAASTANEFGVMKIAVTTTHGQSELPDSWNGRFVKALAIGASGDLCHVAFSKTTGREVDRAVAATTAGATTKVGWPLQHGIVEHLFVPAWDRPEQGFLIHESSAALTLYLALADG